MADVSLNCGGPLDFGCNASEMILNGLVDTIGNFLEDSLSDVSISEQMFQSAINTSQAWWGIAILVMMISGVISIATGLITMNRQTMLRGIIGSLLSVPATLLGLFLVGQGLTAMDDLSRSLLSGTIGETVSAWFGAERRLDTVGFSQAFSTIMPAKYIAEHVVMMILMFALIAAGALFMALALAFRSVALLLLVAFAPVAFAIFPLKSGDVWARRWVSAVVALVLAKPLMFGSLSVIAKMGESAKTLTGAWALIFMVGLFVVAFMPVMAFSFFSFISAAGSDSGAAQAGGKTSRGASQAGFMMMRAGKGGGGGRGAPGAPGAPGAGGASGKSAAGAGAGSGSGASGSKGSGSGGSGKSQGGSSQSEAGSRGGTGSESGGTSGSGGAPKSSPKPAPKPAQGGGGSQPKPAPAPPPKKVQPPPPPPAPPGGSKSQEQTRVTRRDGR